MLKILQSTISYPEVKWGKAEDRAKNTPLIDILDEMAKVPADGIELWGRHLDNMSEATMRGLAKAVKGAGQDVVVLAAYWDFSSSDEAVAASLEDANRYLQIKDIFGARKIRVFAGAPASAQATPENWARATKGLQDLAHLYRGTGVTFVIETHDEQLADTPQSALRLIKDVNRPSIRINYQRMKGDPAVELNVIYRWVEHVHMSFAARYNSIDDQVMKELMKRGYKNTITVEFCTDSLPKEGEQFDRAKAFAGMKRDVLLLRSLIKK